MSKNIRTQLGKIVGKTLNDYHQRVKPKVDDLKFKEQYQGRIIDCMVGEVDDNYIETPETDTPIVKLEHSKEGLVKVPSIKGKTILVDADGNETDTPGEGCRLVSVGEEEDNKLIILSKNKNLFTSEVIDALCNLENWVGNGAYRNNYVAYNLMNFKNGVTYTNTIPSIKIPPNFYPILYLENVGNGHFLASGLYNNNTSNEMTAPLRKWTFSPQSIGSFRAYVNSWNDENMQKLRKVLEQNIQTEAGNIGSDFVKAKYHKTEILLNEPLRRINNNVFDEIVGNKLIRRVGMLYVDGTNDSLYNLTVASHQNIENLQGFDIRLKNNLIVSQPLKCNNVNYVDNRCDEIWVHSGKGNVIVLRVPKEDLVSCDIVGLKEWLKNNPITIFYKLAEPIIEELPNSIILQGFDDTTMYIENSITPIVTYGYNALIPYKEELKTQKEEVETNTLDIENNIIPYLMDMEFNLMLMEDNE